MRHCQYILGECNWVGLCPYRYRRKGNSMRLDHGEDERALDCPNLVIEKKEGDNEREGPGSTCETEDGPGRG